MGDVRNARGDLRLEDVLQTGRHIPHLAGAKLGDGNERRAEDAQLQQLGHRGVARHVADLELVARCRTEGASRVVPGALEEDGAGALRVFGTLLGPEPVEAADVEK